MDRVVVVERQNFAIVKDPIVPQIAVRGGGAGGGGSSASFTFTQTDVVLGRQSAGGGLGEEIPCNAFGRSVIAASVVAGSLLFAASANAVGTDNANLAWDNTGKVLTAKNIVVPTNLTLSGLTAGSVPFAGAAGLVSQDNANFFWNSVTKRFGVGTNNPLGPLHIQPAGQTTADASALGSTELYLFGALTTGVGNIFTSFYLQGVNGSNFVYWSYRPAAATSVGVIKWCDGNRSITNENTAQVASIWVATTDGTANTGGRFGITTRDAGNASAFNVRLRIEDTGEVSLGYNQFINSGPGGGIVGNGLLHFSPGTARTTKAYGITWGGDTYLYRSAANTLTTDGFLGVGVTAAVELHVASTSASDPRGIMSAQYSTDTNGARMHFRKARGTAASPTVVVSGDTLGRLRFGGYDGSAYLQMGSIDVVATDTVLSGRVPTYMTFSTATDAGTSVLTEAMRITKRQAILVGTTTDDLSNLLQVNGASKVTGAFAATGNITGSAYVSAATDFRINGWSFSRVAHGDGSGGFVGGYNIAYSAGAVNDSTGGHTGVYFTTGGTIRFYATTSANAPGTAAVERMRITATGEILVGTTSIASGYMVNIVGGGIQTAGTISAQSGDFRLGQSFSRVAMSDGGGGFVGGYNITYSAGPVHDSTGSLAGVHYSNAGVVKFFAEGSQTAGTAAAERMRIVAGGNVLIGTTSDDGANLIQVNGTAKFWGGVVLSNAALATNATTGFTYAPSSAGAPTGVPTAQTGTIPFEFDSTNNKLYAYLNGAWKSVTLA